MMGTSFRKSVRDRMADYRSSAVFRILDRSDAPAGVAGTAPSLSATVVHRRKLSGLASTVQGVHDRLEEADP